MTRTALWTLVVVAAFCGWTVALAIEGVPPVYLAVVGGLVVVEMEVFRRMDVTRGKLMAVGELMGLVVIAVGSYLLVSLVIPAPISAALVGLILSFFVWLLASITATDIDAVVQPTDLVGGLTGPAGRLLGRTLLVGLGLTLAVVLASGSLAPPDRPRSLESALFLPYVGYWVVAIGSLSGVHRLRNLANWRRDQAKIDPDLQTRWTRTMIVWLVAAVIIASSLWWIGMATRLVSTAHNLTARAISTITGFLSGLLDPDRSPARNQLTPRVTTNLPESVDGDRLIGPAPAWWDAFLLLAAGVIFAYAYMLFARRSRRTRPQSVENRRWLSSLLALVAALGTVLAGLWRSLVALFRRKSTTPATPQLAIPPNRQSRWVPPDEVRRRITRHYREFVRVAAGGVGVPNVAETPYEYGLRVSGSLDDEPAVGQLSALYAEARFSHHRLTDEDAGRAEEWRMRIVQRLNALSTTDPGV